MLSNFSFLSDLHVLGGFEYKICDVWKQDDSEMTSWGKKDFEELESFPKSNNEGIYTATFFSQKHFDM